MAYIINIKNEAGEVQYPVTKPECVIDENGKNVLQLIRENSGGESYDDTELREQITELLQENEVLRTEVESQAQLIEDLQNTKIDRENDDYYPKMAVGTADNLAGVDEVDSEFVFRQSGGGAITDGVARVQSIKGNSVVWNQNMDLAYALSASSRIDGEVVGNKILGYSKIETASSNLSLASYSFSAKDHYTAVIGHKYMWIVTSTLAETECSVGNKYGLKSGDIWTAATNGYCYIFPFGANNEKIIAANSEFEISARFYDLTKMFGAGNEPTTIEEFYRRKSIVEDEYAYNEGTIYDMKATGIKSVGVNAWDEEWEQGTINLKTGLNADSDNNIRSKNFTKVQPYHSYYFKGNAIILYYDRQKNVVDWFSIGGFRTMTIPNNVEYIKLCTTTNDTPTYNHDICINLSNADINGKYYPYEEASEDLSLVAKCFPQGMRRAGAAHDELRYNKTTNKWEKRAIKQVDLGNLTFSEWQDGMYAANIADMAIKGGILCAKYSTYTYTNVTNKNTGIASLTDKGGIVIYDAAYTTPNAIKTALQGVVMYYEPAEMEWEEIEEKDFNLDYNVWNCGTEQMVAIEPSAPLSANITYGFNAAGLIKQIKAALQAAGLM